MKNSKFPLISLCALLAISNTISDSVFLRIAVGANALVVLAGVIKSIVEYTHGKQEN